MNKLFYLVILVVFIGCSEKQHKTTGKPEMEMNEGLHLTEQQIQLGNIITDTLREHILGNELSLTGTLVPDQNNIVAISARVMGRIEKLFFKNTGEEIKEGEPIYEIYSEELNLAAKELLIAIEKKNSFEQKKIDLSKIIQSARNKLLLYGLTVKQVELIENKKTELTNVFSILSPSSGIVTTVDRKEGEYVMEGATIYHIADYKQLWAEVQIFSENLSIIKNNLSATLNFPSFPNLKLQSKISFINPQLNPNSKINLVRFQIPNNSKMLKPGMQVNATVLLNRFNALSLPTDAIILDGKGASVWKRISKNHFANIMVETGIEASGYTEIKSGLELGDEVVVSGAYLLTSEYRFKNGTEGMEGHHHGH